MADLALDVETNARDPRFDSGFKVLGVSYCSSRNSMDYLPLGHYGISEHANAVVLRRLRSLLDQSSRFVFHNAKFDLLCLQRLGFDLWDKEWYDTMLMQHFVDENIPNKSLDYLGKHYFNEGKEVSEEFSKFVESFGWEFLPVSMIEAYAIQDAKLTLKLFYHLLPLFQKEGFL